MAIKNGFWNGLPTEVRKVVGTVKDWEEGDPPLAWWKDLAGQEVKAVEVNMNGVNYGGGIAYLYDDDGSGWLKVTEGHGSPRYGHKDVPLINISARED
jgi:hypothetical protein